MTDAQRWIRIEEELHLVDMSTRRPVRRAVEVLAAMGETATGRRAEAGHPRAARHGALVISDVGTHTGLGELGDAVRRNRARVAEAAGGIRTGVVAAGSLASPGVEFDQTPEEPHPAPGRESQTRAAARFRVVVQTADADEAQYAARRVASLAPVFLALSASSPYWADGTDSGYASTRYFEAQWSPAHLPAYAADTADEALAAEDEIVGTGVVAGREAISVVVRPARDGGGIELVACDSCSTVDTLVVVAALFRAAVDRVLTGRAAGPDSWDGPSDAVLAAAFWRAARSGLEGDLVDVATGRPGPAAEVLSALVDDHLDQLRAGGEVELVLDLLDGIRGAGTSATRQRRAHRRRGRHSDVTAVLLAETVDRIRPRETTDDRGMRSMLAAYSPLGEAVTEEVHDEAITSGGDSRPEYVDVLKAVSDLGAEALCERKGRVDDRLRSLGVTLNVYGEVRPQVFPLDAVPRIVPADQWGRITVGIEQRARAMELFLRDIYGAGEITRAGVVPAEALQRAPGFRPTGRSVPEGVLHAPVCGVDLVSTSPGEWIVLEDNLRMPGGLALAVALRDRITEGYPEFGARAQVHDPRDALGMLADTLRAAAPAGVDEPAIAVVIAEDERESFDLNQVAAAIGGVLVTPAELRCDGDRLWRTGGSGSQPGRESGREPGREPGNEADGEPVDVLFVRMDEEMLLSSTGADGTVLRRGLLSAMAQGGVAVVNAPGNGAADDKAIYALVPKIIDFYLGEKPLIGQVDTLLCADPEQLQQVLDRLGELVVKPIDGYGGSDITVGPECSPRELDERREELRRHGDRFVAQEVQPLSTLPTFDGHELQRRHVDMRAFVMLRAGPSGEILASAPPVALTRVAPAGTMVVNASSGGGGKDTWIHRA